MPLRTAIRKVIAGRHFWGAVGGGALAITTASLPSATQDTFYTTTLAATGGTPPYTWTAYSDASAMALDPELILDTVTGTLYGFPHTTATYLPTFVVTDSLGATATATLTHVVNSSGALAIQTDANLHGAHPNYMFNQQILVTGGTWPYTFAVTGGSLPANCSLSSSTGVIKSSAYGTSFIAAGTYTFTITATDAVSATASRTFTLVCATNALVIGRGPWGQATHYAMTIPAAVVGKPWSYPVDVFGGTAPYTYTVVGGSLPTNVTLNSSTGVLSGTVGGARGIYRFWVQVTDNAAVTQIARITLEVFALSETRGGAVVAKRPFLTMTKWRIYAAPGGNVWTATNNGSNGAAGSGAGNRTGCGLQYALDNCAAGDRIQITAGLTYTGPFILRRKSSNSAWIYIESDSLGSLPASGVRVNVSHKASMPKIVTSSLNGNCFVNEAASGGNVAHHYRIVGCNLDAGSYSTYGLFLTIGEITYAALSHHMVLDRCVLSANYPATTANTVYHGITMQSAHAAVVDCYSEPIIGMLGTGDVQTLFVGTAPGPTHIENNYISAATEGSIFGGSDSGLEGLCQNNVTYVRNDIWKQSAWYSAPMDIKNLFELKSGRFVYVGLNTLANVWGSNQDGTAAVLTNRSQEDGNPWNRLTDITWEHNTSLCHPSGFGVTYEDDIDAADSTARFTFLNSTVLNGGSFDLYAAGTRGILITNQVPDILFDHCMILMAKLLPTHGYRHAIYFSASGQQAGALWRVHKRFVCINSILEEGEGGIYCDLNYNTGAAALNDICDITAGNGYLVTNNVMIGGSGLPAGNFTPADYNAVGFANWNNGAGRFNNGDYTLSGGSSYKGAGKNWDGLWFDGMPANDGTDIGPNYTKIRGNVLEGALSIDAITLPAGIVGQPYKVVWDIGDCPVALNARGGSPPYTWSVDSGALPPGLVLDSYTGSFAALVPLTTNGTVNATIPGPVTGFGTGCEFASNASQRLAYVMPVNTTVTVSGNNVTLSNAASGSGTNSVFFICVPTTAVGSPFNFTVRVTDRYGNTAVTPTLTIAVS
jgi:hypothetical protein